MWTTLANKKSDLVSLFEPSIKEEVMKKLPNFLLNFKGAFLAHNKKETNQAAT